MKISVSRLISRTLEKLDESEEIIAGHMQFCNASADLRTLIRSWAEEAAEEVMRGADIDEIDEWLNVGIGASEMKILDETVEIRLPADTLRLLFVKMDSWSRGVAPTVRSDSSMASLRRYRLRRHHLRGEPMVAVGYGRNSMNAEIFGADPGDREAEAGYLPVPRIDESDEIWIPRSLIGAVTTRIARLTAASRGE